MTQNATNSGMDEKTLGMLSYLTLIGFIVVLVIRKDKTEYTSFHLRQMAGLIALQIGVALLSVIMSSISGWFSIIASAMYFGVFILWLISFLGAVNEEKRLAPYLGEQFQDWFKNAF